MTQATRDESKLPAVFTPATPRDRRVAFALVAAIACVVIGILPNALAPLPRIDGFVPAAQAVIVAVELITAALLFAHYATEHSRALLCLACGYLFSAVVVAAHTLTFPGAFAPTGLFDARLDTAAWLYVPWHLAIPISAIVYSLAKQKPGDVLPGSPATMIQRAALGAILTGVVVAWAIIAARDRLPMLAVSETTFDAAASVIALVPLIASVAACIVLWNRRSSVLDEWLMVALIASVAETALIASMGASRFTLSFYTTRMFAVVVSSAVLVALLTDMARLYMRMSAAVKAVQRERATRLMNLDVVISSIGHEIRQPLTVTRMCTEVIDSVLRRLGVNVDEVRESLDDISSSTVRIGETIESFRSLYKNADEDQITLDVNEIVQESLRPMISELDQRAILLTRRFAADLPPVVGRKGQLREVFTNIVQNAMDAMVPLENRSHTLQVTTSYASDQILIAIEDSGTGIGSERLPTLFTAFISTKEFGMGLGLSICQMIVDRHHGHLSVASELGQWTRFEVRLPVSMQPNSPALAERSMVKMEA